MTLSNEQLINLPVYTQKQKNYLGRVSGFEFSPDTHTIIKYFVSQSSFVKDILGQGQGLEIASAQVFSITEEKMTVEDNVATDLKTAQAKIKEPAVVSASLSRALEQ